MSFLDAFQGYHQIPLAMDNLEKTYFVTPIGNYHYKVMPFGLKNAGSTYQRMMTKMFESQIGKNIEVYIDDVVVKSKIVSEHIEDLTNIFEILKGHKLRLNASKCSFGVGSGKFLNYMVTHRCLLLSTCINTKLTASTKLKAEIRYLPLEKAILAMVYSTRKVPHYFQAHTMVILIQLPLKAILRSVDYTGRIAKWGTILGAFEIKYMPRTLIKGQVLADLVAEFAEGLAGNQSEEHMGEKSVGLVTARGVH